MSRLFLFGMVATALAASMVARAGEMVLAGVHPTAPLSQYARIHALKAYEGRIYLGYGDGVLHPAIAVVAYEPGSATFRAEYSIGTDAIDKFRIVGTNLYVPSSDPVHFEEFADFSVRSGGVWTRHTPAGFYHVLDMTTRTGNDLWFVGSKSINETGTQNAAVWRSLDGGKTWSDVTLGSTEFRYYYCFTLHGNVYVRDTVYQDSGPTRIPLMPYQSLLNPVNIGSGTNEVVVGVAVNVLVSFNGTNWTTLKTNVANLSLVGSQLYTLDIDSPSGTKSIWTADATQGLPLTWTRVPVSNVPSDGTSIDILDGAVYVGDEAGRLWVGKLDGSEMTIPAATVINEMPDGIGRAIAADATTLVIGAPEFGGGAIASGQVVVWSRTNSTSGREAWGNPQTIDPPDPIWSGWFGKGLALNGDLLAILEAGVDESGSDSGSSARVHLYQRHSGAWRLQRTLVVGYAQSVALNSNVLWVACSAALLRYELAVGPSGVTAHYREFFSRASSPAQYEPFTRVVANGKRVAFASVGDYSRQGGPGQVTVLEQQSDVWQKTMLLAQRGLTPSGLTTQPDAFGFALAMSGDWLAVGAPRNDTLAYQNGAVFLYQAIEGYYVLRQKIVAPVPQEQAAFGSSVAFDGDYLVIGAPGLDTTNGVRRGVTYVYRLEGGTAVALGQIDAPPGSITEFGANVYLDGNTILVASRATALKSNPLDRIEFVQITDLVASNSVDLAVMASVTPRQPMPGTPAKFFIVATNAGPSSATEVRIRWAKPHNATVVSSSASAGVISEEPDAMICTVAGLTVGEFVTFEVTAEIVLADPCEISRSRITVSATGFDLRLRDNETEITLNELRPAITIVSPPEGASVSFGSSVALSSVCTFARDIVEVAYYTNGVHVGTAANAPFALELAGVPPGRYIITAAALDQCGLTGTSAPVRLLVRSNVPPSIAIASPLDATRLMSTNSLTIDIAAVDEEGHLESVELFAGANLLRRFESAPFRYIWTNVPPGHWTLWARARDNGGATNTGVPVLIVVGQPAPHTNWVAFNDHEAGVRTHVNATRWSINDQFIGNRGTLRNIASGASVSVSLSIGGGNNSSFPWGYAGSNPAPGTPAAAVFGDYVDFATCCNGNVSLPGSQSVTYWLSGLDPARRYSLKMTAVWGGTYNRRAWTLMTLNGPLYFRTSHSAGALTSSMAPLQPNQVAINTGNNLAGDIASWDDIVPGPNGLIAVVSTQYTGPLPDGGLGWDAKYAYVPTVMRLEAYSISPPLLTNAPSFQTVSPGVPASFELTGSAVAQSVYQWFHDGEPIAGATSPVLQLPQVHVSDAGQYSMRVSSTNGHVISAPDVLSVFSQQRTHELELAGPVGQKYRIDARSSLNETNTWLPLTNFVLPHTPFHFRDVTLSNVSQRFYRAVAVP